MSIPLMADGDMEDLPRTVRREKEARAREAREREASGLSAPQPEPVNYAAAAERYDTTYSAEEAYPASVRSIDVPFFRLMLFFMKAVFAAVPALMVLIALLWLGGQALEAAFPELLKAKILITFPNS
jgi:anti-sigma factor RsiW